MKPLQQGDLDCLCALYAVVNAVRLCCALGPSQSQTIFKAIVKGVAKDLPRIASSGSTDDDVKHYLRIARQTLGDKYGLEIVYSYREFSSYKTMRSAVVNHLSKSGSAVLVSVDAHMTVATAVIGNLWEVKDSSGLKYVHCVGDGVTYKKPLLRAMPELTVFLVRGKCMSVPAASKSI